MNEYLRQFREKYPQYDDLPDMELAKALHEKYYADLSFRQFADRIGLADEAPPPVGDNLPPMLGGILDFAKAAILPLAPFTASPSFAKQEMAELRARAPEATATAGKTLPLLASAAAGAGLSRAIGAASGGPLSRWAVQRGAGANALGFPAGTAAPAGRSAVLELLKRYALPGAGGGIGAELLRRAIDR